MDLTGEQGGTVEKKEGLFWGYADIIQPCFVFLNWHSFSKGSWKVCCYHTSLSLLSITPVLNSPLSLAAASSLCDLWTHDPNDYAQTHLTSDALNKKKLAYM